MIWAPKTLRMLRSIASLAALATSACSTSRAVAVVSSDDRVTNYLGSMNGVVLAFNPATCAFGPQYLEQLQAVAERSGLPLIVVFFGVFADSAVHQEIRNEFRVRAPSTMVSHDSAQQVFHVAAGGVPTLLLVRRGSVVIRVHGSAVSSVPLWLPTAVGAQHYEDLARE